MLIILSCIFSVNIAEDRPTYSKTLKIYRSSGKAVDVDPYTFYKSVDENNQWWRVKLEDTVYVRLLAIRNQDCEENIVFYNLL